MHSNHRGDTYDNCVFFLDDKPILLTTPSSRWEMVEHAYVVNIYVSSK